MLMTETSCWRGFWSWAASWEEELDGRVSPAIKLTSMMTRKSVNFLIFFILDL